MIRVVIADDHPIVRHGLRQVIAKAQDLAVVGEVGDGLQAIEMARKETCDVLLLDISMPGMSGIDVLKQLRGEGSKLPVLILSVHPEDHYAVRVLKAGASGYLTKETAAEELIKSIRTVASGKKYVSASLAERLATYVEGDEQAQPHEALSDREYTVLCLMASGKASKQIAGELNLSVATISTYRARILEKMGLKSNAELTYYAVKHGLVD